MGECDGIGLGRARQECEHFAHVGAEYEATSAPGHDERAAAQLVAREQTSACVPIPDGQRELAT
jgi:hypothetical protein